MIYEKTKQKNTKYGNAMVPPWQWQYGLKLGLRVLFVTMQFCVKLLLCLAVEINLSF